MSQWITNIFYRQRKDFQKTYAGRDQQFPPLPGIICQADIPYAGDTLPAHRLDIYYPEKRQDVLLPVMINIHGVGLFRFMLPGTAVEPAFSPTLLPCRIVKGWQKLQGLLPLH